MLMSCSSCWWTSRDSDSTASRVQPSAHVVPTPAYFEAKARCEGEDDCADLAKILERGELAPLDEEGARAAHLKGCLAGHESSCVDAVFMLHGAAPPGSAEVTAAWCKEEPNGLVCNSIDEIRKAETRSSNDVQKACVKLLATPSSAPADQVGPLVDRCPGLSTREQRLRARQFRSPDDVNHAYEKAKHGSPHEMRVFYERLSGTIDPRADEILALGKKRFGQKPDDSFIKKGNAVKAISAQLLCAVDEESAYLAYETSGWDLLPIVSRLIFPPILLFDLPSRSEPAPTDAERAETERRQREAANKMRAQLLEITGAKRLVAVNDCSDVTWFAKAAGN
ncbi:MAG: hypothetical protein U0165_08920 [Polyangiaceae bacterium]